VVAGAGAEVHMVVELHGCETPLQSVTHDPPFSAQPATLVHSAGVRDAQLSTQVLSTHMQCELDRHAPSLDDASLQTVSQREFELTHRQRASVAHACAFGYATEHSGWQLDCDGLHWHTWYCSRHALWPGCSTQAISHAAENMSHMHSTSTAHAWLLEKYRYAQRVPHVWFSEFHWQYESDVHVLAMVCCVHATLQAWLIVSHWHSGCAVQREASI
jgi:hypothetical protein